MLSSINFLFLFSLAVTSWIILCYFEEIIEQRHMPSTYSAHKWRHLDSRLLPPPTARHQPWLVRGQGAIDTVLKWVGSGVLLNYLLRHTVPGDWVRTKLAALLQVVYMNWLVGVSSGAMHLEPYRRRSALHHRRITMAQGRRQGEEVSRLLVTAQSAVYMQQTVSSSLTTSSIATIGRRPTTVQEENSTLMWHKYLKMQRYPLGRTAMMKLLDEHHLVNPMLSSGGYNNSDSNKTPIVVSTEQLQALQGFYQIKPPYEQSEQR